MRQTLFTSFFLTTLLLLPIFSYSANSDAPSVSAAPAPAAATPATMSLPPKISSASSPSTTSTSATTSTSDAGGAVGGPAKAAAPMEPPPQMSAESTPSASIQAPVEVRNGQAIAQTACLEAFAAKPQEKLRPACVEGAAQSILGGLQSALHDCKSAHKDQERSELICLVGAEIGESIRKTDDTYRGKTKSCQTLFPITSDIDIFLQEACLNGVYLRVAGTSKPHLDQCRSLSAERSFIAPCGAGLSLAYDLEQKNAASAGEDNSLCMRYFDKTSFHLGYRSCLNARSLTLGPDLTSSTKDVVRQCNDVISNSKSETERAACIIGLSLYESVSKKQNPSLHFKTCGDSKVTYAEHDYLACLTAVSLLDFMDKGHARKACKEVFNGRKSRSRSDCEQALR